MTLKCNNYSGIVQERVSLASSPKSSLLTGGCSYSIRKELLKFQGTSLAYLLSEEICLFFHTESFKTLGE